MKSIDEKIAELEKQLQDAKAEKDRIELDNPTTIGGRIKKVMRIKGISQNEVAIAIGVNREMVSRYSNNKRKIPAEKLGKIAKLLGVSCDYLIFGEELKATHTKIQYKGQEYTIPELCQRMSELENFINHINEDTEF